MKQPTLISCLAIAALALGCAADAEVDTEPTYAPFGQAPFGQGTELIGANPGFDGTLDWSEARFTARKSLIRLSNLRVEGSQLKAENRFATLTGTRLVGTEFRSDGVWFKIVAAQSRIDQPTTMSGVLMNRDNADAWQYRIKFKIDGKYTGEVCGQDVDGKRWAMFNSGSWDPNGDYHDDGEMTIGCSRGTIFKCAFVWGYKPWKSLYPPRSRRRVGMRPYHTACVKAASAFLCNTGFSHTREGNLVDMIDNQGFNVPADPSEIADYNDKYDTDFDPHGFVPESWFDEGGALAVNYERYRFYIGERAGSNGLLSVTEPDEVTGQMTEACIMPQYSEADPWPTTRAPWLIKVSSDEGFWPYLIPEWVPPDLIRDPEGPLGGSGDGDGEIRR